MEDQEIVDHMGKPRGASVSADGHTITADTIIGDRQNMAEAYTLGELQQWHEDGSKTLLAESLWTRSREEIAVLRICDTVISLPEP